MSFYSNLIALLPGLLTFTLAIFLLNSSTKIINEGTQALVERMGKYSRTLDPGINFIFPIFEYTVLRDSVREQNLDIPLLFARTKDGIDAELDLAIIWQIKDLGKSYYEVENVEACLMDMVNHIVVKKMSSIDMKEVRTHEFDCLKEEINGIVEKWGITVTHFIFRELILPNLIKRAEVVKQVQRIQEETISEVSREVQNIEKKAEDAGIKTPENSANFESFFKDLQKSLIEIIGSPRYDFRGANFGGSFAGTVQGSQVGGAISSDDRIFHNISSQLPSSDLHDKDVCQEERGESLAESYASEPELNTNVDQGQNE